jgi:hypothetical protein
MLNSEFYDLTQSLWSGFSLALTAVGQRLGGNPAPPPQPLLQVQQGMAESPGWFLVQAAEFEPEPLTVTGLRHRDVYASPSIVRAILEMMAAEKWFDRQGEAYHLTKAGQTLIGERQAWRDDALTTLDPLLEVDLASLESLLDRVINGCLASNEPPGSWCLIHSRRRSPAADAVLSVKLLQYVADINAFRDDAHMAAWRPHGVMGYTWEAFSLVCASQADSAIALFNQLAHRGYSHHDYGHALESLVNRGWLEVTPEAAFRPTVQGREIRQQVESLTDAYFYAPWYQSLSEHEIAMVNDLVVQLRRELQALAD